MRPLGSSRAHVLPLAAFLVTCSAAPSLAQTRAPVPTEVTRVPQTAFSLCPCLNVVSREEVIPGTALAVSPDGRFRLSYFQTPSGAHFDLLDRDSGEKRQFDAAVPKIPPGIVWRILEAEFSPDSRWLAVRTIGATWIFPAGLTQPVWTIAADSDKEIYPGKMSWGGDHLAVIFWPAESFLADAEPKKPVQVKIFDAPTGAVALTFNLPLALSDSWTVPRLSPDALEIAVLERARRWPGKARLLLFSTRTGKSLWERNLSAEDIAWSADGKRLLSLGSELTWLDSSTATPVRQTAGSSAHSDLQRLTINENAGLALGRFAEYSAFARALGGGKKRVTHFILWNLPANRDFCQETFVPEVSADPWITSRGEIISLEETYDVRPPLRLLKSARIITYKFTPPPSAQSPPPSKPASP
ncbi:MAG: hypothetical protein ACRD50_12290 [Candidatus Acidiferrales bacterium]